MRRPPASTLRIAPRRASPGADQRCERVAASQIADRGRRPGPGGALLLAGSKNAPRRRARKRQAARCEAGGCSAPRPPRAAPRIAPRRRAASARRLLRSQATADRSKPENRRSICREQRTANVDRNGAPEEIVKTRGSRIAMPVVTLGGREGKPCCGRRAFGASAAKRRVKSLPVRLLGGNADFRRRSAPGERSGQDPRREQTAESCLHLGPGGETEETCPADDLPTVVSGARRPARRPRQGARSSPRSSPDRRAPARRSRSPGR